MQFLSLLNPSWIFNKISGGIKPWLPRLNLFSSKNQSQVREHQRKQARDLVNTEEQTENISDETRFSATTATELIKASISPSNLRQTFTEDEPTINFRPAQERFKLDANLLFEAKSTHLSKIHGELIKKIETLNGIESGPEQYVQLISSLVNRSIDFIDNLQTLVIEDLFKRKGFPANDINLARVIQSNKELSMLCAKQTLSAIEKAFSTVADKTFTSANGSSQKLREAVVEQLQAPDTSSLFRNIFYASHYGALSQDHVEQFQSSIEHDGKISDKNLHVNLQTAKIFLNASLGSVLFKKEDNGNYQFTGHKKYETQFIKDILKDLFKTIYSRLKIQRRAKQKEQQATTNTMGDRVLNLALREKTLRVFLHSLYLAEKQLSKTTNELKNNEILKTLGFNQTFEKDQLSSLYQSKDFSFVEDFIGKFNTSHKIKDKEIEAFSLVEELENKEGFFRHFERIMIEIALLAAFDAISTSEGIKSNDDSYSKQSLYEDVPWFNAIFKQNKAYYQELIKEKGKEEGFNYISYEMADIGNALRDRTEQSEFFNLRDFARRYGINKDLAKLTDITGDMTKVSQINLILDLYSNLSASIDDIPEKVLTIDQKKMFRKIIKFFRDMAAFRDPETKKLMDVSQISIEQEESKYQEMRNKIDGAGFLRTGVPLILKVLNYGKHRDPGLAILASQLMFYIASSTKIHSNKIGALENRVKIFEFFFNDADTNTDAKGSLKKILPNSLYTKLFNELAGINAAGTVEGFYAYSSKQKLKPEDYRHGLIKALCIDIFSKFEALESAEANEIKRADPHGPVLAIPVRNRDVTVNLDDMLNIYKKLEDIIAANPRHRKFFEDIRKKYYNDHEPLLPSMDQALVKVLDVDSKRVIDFTRKTVPEYKSNLVEHIIFNKLGSKGTEHGIIDQLAEFKQPDGSYQIYDNDKSAMKLVSKLFKQVNNLNLLLQDRNLQNFTLHSEAVIRALNKNNDVQIDSSKENLIRAIMRDLVSLFKSKITIISDSKFQTSQDAFPGQSNLKRLINQFTAAYNINLETISEKELLARKTEEDSGNFAIAA